MDEPRKVFVYGTLMPDEQRWGAISRYAISWDEATAIGTLWDTADGYPAATFDGGDGEVVGVVVTIRAEWWDDVLRRLDEIEDEGRLYRRIEIDTSHGRATTYAWLGATDGFRPLPQGWRQRDT
jgi:gamma-glutamylcyclotransferase (GGCT)/AIG2-like uncharacterized protein YtfP